MRRLVLLLICSAYLNCQGQSIKYEFDGHNWKAPYHLDIPKDWGIERFEIPINFAPQILYKGIEDIRFAPGWAKVKTDEYWTYAFLWYLDGPVKTNEMIIASNLKAYYTGLINSNTDSAKAASGKAIPVTTVFKKVTTSEDDVATYNGTIYMMDYMQQQPITLNCIVHLKSCPDDDKTILFYEISPKPFGHNNWNKLNQLWLDFSCKQN